MQLKLRHTINREIMIYPGYVFEPSIKYRVFHYGLPFGVGNWSFDKAKWREIDIVNKCWAKFPEPPDPSSLNRDDEKSLQQNLLSIECIKTLNDALDQHHERMGCNRDSSLSTSKGNTKEESVISKKFDVKGKHMLENDSDEFASVHNDKMGIPSSFRFWVLFFCVFSGLGFLVVIFWVHSGHKRKGMKMKHHRVRRRSLYT
jgi:peptidyl serine alpha-galactosyltransferase